MTLIVETGLIIANADSYVSAATAIDFLENYYGEYDAQAAAFLAFPTSRQEVILRRATADLDKRYRKRWKGYKVSETQSLDWPRVDVLDEDGYEVSGESIPRQIQRAEIEIAKRLAAGVAIFEDQDRGGRIQSEKVDVISISYFADAPPSTLFEGLDAELKGLLRNENRVVRA